MQQPADTQPLAEALAVFRATRSAYPSTSDQALSQLLERLAEEVIALRRQPAAVLAQPAESQPDLAALQAQLAALQGAYEAQQADLTRLGALAVRPRTAALPKNAPLRGEVVSPPREMRPMDYWEQHIPDYGDTGAEADLADYHTRPRVRPEDIILTAEDHARLERRRPQQKQWVTILGWIIALLLFLFVFNGIGYLRGLFEGLR